MSGAYTITERADGRFFARINIGRDKNGRIKYKSIYGRTKKEVKEKIRAFTTDLDNYGKPLDNTSITLSEWTYKHLFTNIQPTVVPGTFERYMSIYNTHIKASVIGDMKVKDIQQMHLQHYFNEKKSLSKSSLKKIYELLNKSFKFAISNNLIRLNPIESVKLPSSEVKTKETEILTLDEQKAYMKVLEHHKQGILYLTALYTGMRIGEVLALKWHHIDFDNATISVCETIRRVRVYENDGASESKLITKSPKTQKGYREIPIPKPLLLELKKHKLSSYKSNDKLVFCTKTGTPLQYTYVWKTHRTLCKKACIRPTTIHALRHTFASRSIEAGIDVKTVSELLGHTDTQITWNTYVHSTNDSKKAAADTMGKLYQSLLI
ncbi:MAG: site-specific integrase [Clostridiales bacterium]|jgi:integrase|nr:site-specific integrase [Clostridiales bacterium]